MSKLLENILAEKTQHATVLSRGGQLPNISLGVGAKLPRLILEKIVVCGYKKFFTMLRRKISNQIPKRSIRL